MDIIEVAHGQFEPMTLEERVRKATRNIAKALEELPNSELEMPLNLTGKEYLIQQGLLLQALLESKTW